MFGRVVPYKIQPNLTTQIVEQHQKLSDDLERKLKMLKLNSTQSSSERRRLSKQWNRSQKRKMSAQRLPQSTAATVRLPPNHSTHSTATTFGKSTASSSGSESLQVGPSSESARPNANGSADPSSHDPSQNPRSSDPPPQVFPSSDRSPFINPSGSSITTDSSSTSLLTDCSDSLEITKLSNSVQPRSSNSSQTTQTLSEIRRSDPSNSRSSDHCQRTQLSDFPVLVTTSSEVT